MSKLETVRQLPLGRAPLTDTVETMKELQRTLSMLPAMQQQLMQLPQQTAELAAAIEPLAKALEKILPRLDSLDRRLAAIEAAIPRHQDGRLATIAAQASLTAGLREILEALSKPFAGWLGRK